MATIVVGVDTGGTFTDFVIMRDGHLQVHKVTSTTDDPARAILQGLGSLGVLDKMSTLVHGSTVATNAVLEHKGVLTGLVTTSGFRDVLEIGRQTRPKLYDLRVTREPPLVPRELRFEVVERLDERGETLIPLDIDSVDTAIQELIDAQVQSVAISLLFSFMNPEHEQVVAESARNAGLAVSASHEVLPEFREYERTSTVVLNAYVGPIMSRYLEKLERAMPSQVPLRIMQSNGGSISAATARREAARTLLSGPAAGVVGAAYVGRSSGFEQAITFDMGGTSTDVALYDGALVETTDGKVGGYPSKLPMIDIHTVGAGGGSIAWFDTGGALRVGPASAGAVPGPAAYGRGGDSPTVTDANVALGRLIPDAFLGGDMTLVFDAARDSMQGIADRLQSTVEEAALGVVRIANANMEAAIRVISVERGFDPRRFTLIAFGGAGPLHACELAKTLRIPRVLIPSTPGVLSALGMLAADILKDYVRTVMLGTSDSEGAVAGVLAELGEQGRADLRLEGLQDNDIEIEQFLDLRYAGQSYELVVPFMADINATVTSFHTMHEHRFGYSDPNERVQIVNVRVKARGLVEQPPLIHSEDSAVFEAEVSRHTDVWFSSDEGPRQFRCALFERGELGHGAQLSGPAIVTQYDTTTVVPPGWVGQVDQIGNLILGELAGEAPRND